MKVAVISTRVQPPGLTTSAYWEPKVNGARKEQDSQLCVLAEESSSVQGKPL